MTTSRYRVSYIVSHPIQYQAPMLRYLAGDPQLDLTVYFMTDFSTRSYHDEGFATRVDWDIPLTQGYRYEFLPRAGRADRLSWLRPFVRLPTREFRTRRFDVLWIHGYANQTSLRALRIAKSSGMKALLRGESHLSSHVRSPLTSRFKELALPALFRRIDGFLSIGTKNREYYEHYGVPPEKIFDMPYAVDNQFFQSLAASARPVRHNLRTALGLKSNRPVILYASKFQVRKRVDILVDAYRCLSPDGINEPTPYLLLIGDGETRSMLESRVRQLGWSSVKFLGFKNQTELPAYYDLCDVFVLASEFEPWGLVINEVMNAGKAVIVSDQVGAGPDLVKDGINGHIVPTGDVQTLAERLRSVVSNREISRRMGEESLKRITQWNFERNRNGLLHALEFTLRR